MLKSGYIMYTMAKLFNIEESMFLFCEYYSV